MTVSFEGDGTGVHCATVFTKSLWEEFCEAVRSAPPRSIPNEALGGRTSDHFMSTRDVISPTGPKVSSDPARIEGFLAAFPGGHFGTMLWWVVACEVDFKHHPEMMDMMKRYEAWAKGPDGPDRHRTRY